MGDDKNFLDASANEKATLATSRRSFIAGWKLCAGVALGLGLGLAGRRASAAPGQNPNQGPGQNPYQGPGQNGCFLPGTRIKTRRASDR